MVVPVFYGVNPSNVRKQEGSYTSAFAAHEESFKDQNEMLKKWRNSLTTVRVLKVSYIVITLLNYVKQRRAVSSEQCCKRRADT